MRSHAHAHSLAAAAKPSPACDRLRTLLRLLLTMQRASACTSRHRQNQGQCGSCWAFSTVGSVEGAFFAASGKLIPLAEEELVECDNVDSGCQGGAMENAFIWIEKHGLASQAQYNYTSGGGTVGRCNRKAERHAVVGIDGFHDIPTGDEHALQEAVVNTPVSIAIEADKSIFQLYKGGVLDNPKCGLHPPALDHGVLLVGYGSDERSGKDYWTVKNSWGASWGEHGYVRMVRGKNMCGVASRASYPLDAHAV